jgi:aquaporin Z
MAHGACEFIATLALLLTVMGGFAALIAPLGLASVQTALLAILVGTTIALIARSPIGKLSGAHMNPAVSLAFWMQGRMGFTEMMVYVLMQFGGAITACGLLSVLLPTDFQAVGFGVLRPVPSDGVVQVLFLEGAAAAGLVVVLFYTLSHQSLTRYAAVSVAAYVAVLTLLMAPLTGASFNPARAAGAALVAHQLEGQWPYWVAPLLGATAAAMLYRMGSWLPQPLYHRLNHSHLHSNYTWSVLERLWRSMR